MPPATAIARPVGAFNGSSSPINTNSSVGYGEVDWNVPEDSWESHVHVFDPQEYAYDPNRAYTPVPASYDELLAFNADLVATHTPQNIVLVQPSPYGTDNSLILDLLRNHSASDQERLLRAIAVIDPDVVKDEQLLEMDALGVRGIRVNAEGSASYEKLRRAIYNTAARVKIFTHWSCQLYIPGESWDHIADVVRDLPLPVIADHQGGMAGLSALPNGTTECTSQPGFSSLLSLARSGQVFVKISGFYRSSELTTGGYDDLEPLIRYLAQEIPQQLIWGSDWPHTRSNRSLATRLVPEPFRDVDNEAILRNIKDWVGPELWYNMTVVTPAKLYV